MSNIARNRKASFDYFITDKLEAGLVLEGWEVKALRAGKISLVEGYISIKKGEAWLHGCHISPLKQAGTHVDHDPVRSRKLLMSRRELDKWIVAIEMQGRTCVPLSMYWKESKVKLEIGLAEGKKKQDKRASEQSKDMKREADRVMKRAR